VLIGCVASLLRERHPLKSQEVADNQVGAVVGNCEAIRTVNDHINCTSHVIQSCAFTRAGKFCSVNDHINCTSHVIQSCAFTRAGKFCSKLMIQHLSWFASSVHALEFATAAEACMSRSVGYASGADRAKHRFGFVISLLAEAVFLIHFFPVMEKK